MVLWVSRDWLTLACLSLLSTPGVRVGLWQRPTFILEEGHAAGGGGADRSAAGGRAKPSGLQTCAPPSFHMIGCSCSAACFVNAHTSLVQPSMRAGFYVRVFVLHDYRVWTYSRHRLTGVVRLSAQRATLPWPVCT